MHLVLIFLAGVLIVLISFGAAIRNFMLTGGDHPLLGRVSSSMTQSLFAGACRILPTETSRTALMRLYAPVSLLFAFAITHMMNALGFAFMYYSLGDRTFETALIASGIAMTTLGFAGTLTDYRTIWLAVAEAFMSTTVFALLIGCLPAIYASYNAREQTISQMEARLGPVRTGVGLLQQFARNPGHEHLGAFWQEWSNWFVSLGQARGSLATSLFLHAPRQNATWALTAAAVLDSAALSAALMPTNGAADAVQCIRTGSAALADVLSQVRLRIARTRTGAGAIRVSRQQFDQAQAELARSGLPVGPGDDAAWSTFVSLRVLYDAELAELGRLTGIAINDWPPPDPVPLPPGPDMDQA